MRQRTRKLFGTMALLLWITVYALLVMVLAAMVLSQVSKWLQPFFYMAAGFAWVPPAILIVSWMHGGTTEEPQA
jgi:Protein of unknown function (DUF2842)